MEFGKLVKSAPLTLLVVSLLFRTTKKTSKMKIISLLLNFFVEEQNSHLTFKHS